MKFSLTVDQIASLNVQLYSRDVLYNILHQFVLVSAYQHMPEVVILASAYKLQPLNVCHKFVASACIVADEFEQLNKSKRSFLFIKEKHLLNEEIQKKIMKIKTNLGDV